MNTATRACLVARRLQHHWNMRCLPSNALGPTAEITLSDGATVSLVVRRVPAKLRSIELQRQSNYNGGSEASLLSAVMDQVCLV